MEKSSLKAAKGKKTVKFLPKATSFSFTNPGFSPGRERMLRRGLSGPLLPVLPEPGKKHGRRGFEPPEPSSPKVSCIGTVKHKKKICRSKISSPRKSFNIARFFREKIISRKAFKEPAKAAAPSLGQARRFSSGRDAFANFDWRAQRVASDELPETRCFQAAHTAAGGGGAGLASVKESTLWKKRNVTPLTPLKL